MVRTFPFWIYLNDAFVVVEVVFAKVRESLVLIG